MPGIAGIRRAEHEEMATGPGDFIRDAEEMAGGDTGLWILSAGADCCRGPGAGAGAGGRERVLLGHSQAPRAALC